MAQSVAPSAPLTRPPLVVRLLQEPSAFANSTRVWLVLVAFLGLVNLFITFVGAGLERDSRAVLFSWPVIAIIGLLGLAGIWLSHRTGFPAAWDARISNRQRLLIPAVIGIGFGLLLSGLDLVAHWTQLFAQFSSLPGYNAPWPGSPLFYAGGAIWVEVVYRLLPIPLLLWFVSNLLLRGRAQTQVFWILAVLSSLIEPSQQDLDGLRFGASGLFVASQFIPDFLFNLSQAALFRNYGLVASIVSRVAMYLTWHVAYGNFICRC